MNLKYAYSYFEILANLLKNEELTEVEQKIFETYAFAQSPCFTVRDLVRIIFGKDLGLKGHNTRLEQKIREGIRGLQDRAVPFVSCGDGMYYFAHDLEQVRGMIFDLEIQASNLRFRVEKMRVYYGRQIDPFQQLIDESKKSS
jgi:hypothetical protein